MKQAVKLIEISNLEDRVPNYALIKNLDLVVVAYDEMISVLYGRCLHRGALMADGRVEGHNLICGVHGWDYRYDTGVSEYSNDEALHKFESKIEDGDLHIARAMAQFRSYAQSE